MTHQDAPSLKTKIGFGICDIGGNLFFTAMAFQLAAFLTDTMGMGAALMGVAVMVGRIVDAFTDPLMGYLSDRTTHRWGRRRPYLFFGAIPLAVLFFLIFTKPAFLNSQGSMFAWVTIVYVLLTTAYTSVNIPYGALTPDLTRDYDQQTSLNAYRMSFAVIGTLLGAGAALPIVNSAPNQVAGYALMGAVFGAVSLVTAWATFFAVKEPKVTVDPRARKHSLLKEYIAVATDRTFLRILLPWAAFVTAVTLASGTLIYFARYIFGDEGMATTMMLVLLVGALACFPLWVQLTKRISKKTAYGIGMMLFSGSVLILAYAGDKVPVPVMLGFVALAGVGLSTHYVMAYALIPDAVENHYAETGERREGIFYGLWTFFSKIGSAFAVLLTGIILDLVRYIPNQPQEPFAQQGIRLVFGVLPLVFIAIGAWILRRYPIDKAYYEEIKLKVKTLAEASGTENG